MISERILRSEEVIGDSRFGFRRGGVRGRFHDRIKEFIGKGGMMQIMSVRKKAQEFREKEGRRRIRRRFNKLEGGNNNELEIIEKNTNSFLFIFQKVREIIKIKEKARVFRRKRKRKEVTGNKAIKNVQIDPETIHNNRKEKEIPFKAANSCYLIVKPNSFDKIVQSRRRR